MTQCEEPDTTVVSDKGQVVIPAAIRAELGLKPKTKLLVYRRKDMIILKKLQLPDLTKEIDAMYKRVNARIAKYGELTNDEINEIIHEYRKKKRSK